MSITKTPTEIFIEKAIQKHNNKFSYLKTKYINSKEDVIITCSIHGDFLQTPNSHLRGHGCRKCKYDALNEMHRKEFVLYNEAKEYAITLKINSTNEWKNIVKTSEFRKDIPKAPDQYYKNCGWKSWGEFLGTGTIAPFNIEYENYNQLETEILNLKLETKDEYLIWRKENKREYNTPHNPEQTYKNTGWISWGKFLGTNRMSVANKHNQYVSYSELSKLVCLLKIKTKQEYITWKKISDEKYPLTPNVTYKNNGWINWYCFLNNTTTSFSFMPFKDAKNLVQEQNFKNIKEYFNWRKFNNLTTLPSCPNKTYKNKGWKGNSDFLGTYHIYSKQKSLMFLSYEEAKIIVLSKNIRTVKEYHEWWYINKPKNLPRNPQEHYNKKGWISWAEFLNNRNFRNIFIPFDEAKKFVKNLNIKTEKEYSDWWDVNKSNYLPRHPYVAYKKFWTSWADYLSSAGYGAIWTKNTILKFLTEYRDNIIMAESAELLILLANAGLEYRIDTNEKFKAIILNEEGSNSRVDAVDSLIETMKGQNNTTNDEPISDDNVLTVLNGEVEINEAKVSDDVDVEEDTNIKLPAEAIIESFKLYDHEYIHLENLDQEKVKFLIQNRINKLWNHFLNNRITISMVENELGGPHFTEIKNSFLIEYREVNSIKNPEGYCFPHEPMLMQKLVSHRLKVNKTYGNWSTVGAGKTLAGVYAGRYVGAKNTIVVTYNSTVIGWEKSLNSYFNDCNIFTKSFKNVNFEEGKNNYLILNYEFFQQGQKSENRLYEFIEKNKIDYIILDEVHSVKQRKEDNTLSTDELIEEGFLSSRRHLMMKFLNDIRVKNPDIYFMTMTATPIINNLVEAKKLLEMLQGQKFDELKTSDRSVKAGLEFHKHVVFNGIRYEHTPKNKNGEIIKRNTIEVNINGSDLLERLEGESNDLFIEQIVLDYKLNGIRQYIRKGTMIFTYYVNEIADRIKKYCEDLGFRTALYTGRQGALEREVVKEKFQQGKLDIIIGSLPIGTGVDGFQDVCDRLICIGLPWTHSEYEQLVGRVHREGSPHKVIDIIIPKIVVDYVDNDGKQKSWSRDRHKLNIIKYKKDLFGIVVNGVIPDGIVTDLGSIKQKSLKSLNDIIEKSKTFRIRYLKTSDKKSEVFLKII